MSFRSIAIGAGLLFANKVPEGGAATAGGLLSSVGFIKLAKEANDRLDRIYGELDED
ncbi:TRADD-N-associated membrane domain-containing protein [Chamaesiphon sp. OTE_75_metabat_556]|uniref:TRADD-N-associated membrane domain-containing protein n=1 Tax=Chamaesiphon sp. OTE_75_metabat_556 TaxID=2964692 RepID=UPI0037C00C5A